MTLKEIRILKGLSQKECAEYLGIGARTYQNYENDSSKADTMKYSAYCFRLQEYGRGQVFESVNMPISAYHTSVVTGSDLRPLQEKVKGYRKRNCFSSLEKYMGGDYRGKVCVLYGLRRTGKTTMLFQMLEKLPAEKTAYIKVRKMDNMADLTKDLRLLYDRGVRNVFIDEITLLEDFINTAAVLSDIFSMLGMKIVLSGTDSLGFAMADRDELYDRNLTIHTSFIPYREYERLLGICSVDRYIEYGGTLMMENGNFDDAECSLEEAAFRNDETTRKYIDTAISRNIQHALKNDHDGEYFGALRELYEKEELTNVINRVVESVNHEFLLKVVEERFKSHDFGSAKDLLLHDPSEENAYLLYNVDSEEITERLKRLIDVIEKEEAQITVTEEHMEKIKKYLSMLDLIVNCPVLYESGRWEDHYLFTQPGMRYAIAKALVYSLMQDEYFKSASEGSRRLTVKKILEDVKGKMLEDIVLLETSKALTGESKAFKFQFDTGGEFDMVIYNAQQDTCSLYEIKHSDKAVPKQRRFLEDANLCGVVSRRFGKITNKVVIYRGPGFPDGDIEYRNAEEYLRSLGVGQR